MAKLVERQKPRKTHCQQTGTNCASCVLWQLVVASRIRETSDFTDVKIVLITYWLKISFHIKTFQVVRIQHIDCIFTYGVKEVLITQMPQPVSAACVA